MKRNQLIVFSGKHRDLHGIYLIGMTEIDALGARKQKNAGTHFLDYSRVDLHICNNQF